MNALRNKVQLIGHLGDKVELKNLDSGRVLGRVSMAINETYKNQKGDRVDNTTWHRLVLWGKQAEILQKYTDKGSEVAVEGKISNRSYTDKDGIKRNLTEIVVHDFTFLGKKNSSKSSQTPVMEATDEDDLPF